MFDEIESRAIEAEKELETVNMIRRVVLTENITGEKRASMRPIEAEIVICQYCHKKGHMAARCWQISKLQGSSNNQNRNNPSFAQHEFSNNYNNNNNNKCNNLSNNSNQGQPLSQDIWQNPNNQNLNQHSTVTCGYCKKPSHILKECCKRIYI